jgi:hypothetical protein
MKSPVAAVSLVLLSFAANCGSESGPQQGTEKGPCYPNLTCNAGLTCLSGLCVNAGGGSSAGWDAGSSSGGVSGQADAPASSSLADGPIGFGDTAVDLLAVGGSGGSGGQGGVDAGKWDAVDGPVLPDVPNPLDASAPDVSNALDASGAQAGLFPATPIVDPNSPTPVPSNPDAQFVGSSTGAGPCVTEPENGALYPSNWTRPRIHWTGTSGLVQITVHTASVSNALIVYTMGSQWVMDPSIWAGLSQLVQEQDIVVTVRAAGGGSTTVTFQIAPVGAPGSIVFLAMDPTAVGIQDVTKVQDSIALLRGFRGGDESTVPVLKLSQIKQTAKSQSGQSSKPTCIGCHSATPDPGFVAFVDNWPFTSVIAGVSSANTGAALMDLTAGGLAALNKPWSGAATFSPAVWQAGKRIMVTTSAQQNEQTPWSTDDKEPAKLVWYDLDSPTPPMLTTIGVDQQPIAQVGAGNYGVIARNGDSNGVAFPTWSNDGSTLYYSSSKGGCMDGRLDKGATDLYSVPYNNGKGGDAKPVPGASDKSWEEFYASISPDGALLLFDRVPSGETMYANPHAELYFVPVGSAPGAGTAVRLAANDPVACSGKSSPGINNRLPKWAPSAQVIKGRTYYWFVYASDRAGIPAQPSKYDGRLHEVSQMYLTAITLKDGKYTTYPSIYLWNQPADAINLPDWGTSQIPSPQTP